MNGERRHTSVAAAAGIGYLLAGVALLFQELGIAGVPWSLAVPGVIVAVGFALLATARTAPTDSGDDSDDSDDSDEHVTPGPVNEDGSGHARM